MPRPPIYDLKDKIMSSIPAPRRIVTSNLAVPEGLNKVDNSEPAVEVVDEEVPLVSEFGGLWFGRPVFTHEKLPTSNAGTDISVKPIPNGGLCFPHGANIRYNEIPPGGKAPMVGRRRRAWDYSFLFWPGLLTRHG